MKGENMSYWVYLQNKHGGTLPVDRHMEGGTFVVSGNPMAELNVTYNYSDVYRLINFSISDLNGKRAGDYIEILTELVKKFGDKPYDDYWAPTPGNAGHALSILLAWAKQHPDGIFKVS